MGGHIPHIPKMVWYLYEPTRYPKEIGIGIFKPFKNIRLSFLLKVDLSVTFKFRLNIVLHFTGAVDPTDIVIENCWADSSKTKLKGDKMAGAPCVNLDVLCIFEAFANLLSYFDSLWWRCSNK